MPNSKPGTYVHFKCKICGVNDMYLKSEKKRKPNTGQYCSRSCASKAQAKDRKRLSILLLFICLSFMLPAIAGNVLNKEGYYLEKNPEVLFDADIDERIRVRSIAYTNDFLTDIQLEPSVSDVDYEHIIDVLSFRFKPNRIFVHLGNGAANVSSGYARLKPYKDESGACYVYLKKKDFAKMTWLQQEHVLRHELFHCLGWDHGAYSNKLRHFDNYEVLLRLHDKQNQKNACIVNIEVDGIVKFVPRSKRFKQAYTVVTRDNQVKLRPGRYKVFVNGELVKKKFLCNSKGEIK